VRLGLEDRRKGEAGTTTARAYLTLIFCLALALFLCDAYPSLIFCEQGMLTRPLFSVNHADQIIQGHALPAPCDPPQAGGLY
jgi:hypothetical protein